nr:endonuclease/exonuclease/phosphatase family protein [Streptomyces oceani]
MLVTPDGATAATGPDRIHDIQGDHRISPYAGDSVADVPGIVTGVRTEGSAGFWMQDPRGDDSPATSEGVFVFTDAKPPVQPGDEVRVSGQVSEYVPGGADSGNQSVTQLTDPTVDVRSSDQPLPEARELNAGTVPETYAPQGDPAEDDSIDGLRLRPDRYALDRYESLEGMNVQVEDTRVVGPSSEYDDLWVTVRPDEHPTARGGTLYGSYASQNPGRLKVTSLAPSEEGFPAADVGDQLTGTTAGPLDYDQHGGYHLAARELGTLRDSGPSPERTRPQRDGELAVATYNVENLAPDDDATKYERLAQGVVRNLATPDILALEEVQDDSGAQDDGTVTSERTVGKLIDAISEAGGPRYEWRGIAPRDGQDGGQPGGNIRSGFLFNPERVSFTDRPGGDATTATEVVQRDGQATLSHSPGRITPNDPAWKDSRKPLAGEFRFRSEPVIVVANHFSSKGGDQPLHGSTQPPKRSSEKQRHQQARQVNAFVQDIQDVRRKADVVVLGDLNDFDFSATTSALTENDALRGAAATLPEEERYTYVFQGNSQVLDQTLVSPGVSRFDYDIVHTNAEYADQVSDHDPQVLRFRP